MINDLLGFTAITTSLTRGIDHWVSRDRNLTDSVATEHKNQILVPGGAPTVPDGGATVGLLRVAPGGLEGIREILHARAA